jgi:hypothetical protein
MIAPIIAAKATRSFSLVTASSGATGAAAAGLAIVSPSHVTFLEATE